MQLIIKTKKEFQNQRRVEILHQLDVQLKYLKVLIRVSYKKVFHIII